MTEDVPVAVVEETPPEAVPAEIPPEADATEAPPISLHDSMLANVPTPVKLHLPELKRTIWVRGLTGQELDTLETTYVVTNPDGRNSIRAGIRAAVVQWCTVDENGEQVFKAKERPQIEKMDGAMVNKIFDLAMTESGLGDDAFKAIAGN